MRVGQFRHMLWQACLLACLLPAAQAAETGYTLKATDVKEKPFLDASTLKNLPEKTVVEIVARQGAWMQIRTADVKQGWVRMLSVRLGRPDQKTQPGGNLLSALGIGSRPRPASTSTVTTGVRGFSEEDLANAQPNAGELEKMKSYAATGEEATKLAASGRVSARPVAYFDETGRPLKEGK